MPKLPDSLAPKPQSPHGPEVEWRTISYRSVFMAILGLVVAAGVGVYFAFPDTVGRRIREMFPAKTVVLEGMQQKQARFLNLDGTVRVKKANALGWAPVTQTTLLEKGDIVQTGPDGLARIIFADNTMYNVRADTLIVIEENASHQQNKTTNVAVTVTSGQVDLSTANFSGESTVTISNAVAHMRQDSHALVKNDPKTAVNEVLMTKGSSEILRGSEKMELGQYEKASFTAARDGKKETAMVRERAMGPPLLLSPANLTPLMVAEPKTNMLNFSWTTVPGATSYRVRIANNSIFSSVVYDKTVRADSLKVTGLPEGTYYWGVSSVGVNDKESENSDASKFTIVKQSAEKEEIVLVVGDYIQQGKSVVIIGRTEPGARVMVNDEPVFIINADGSFKHITLPFSKGGAHTITVTAQNSKGKIASKRKTIYIEE